MTPGKSLSATLSAAAALAASKRVVFVGLIEIAEDFVEMLSYLPTEAERKELIAWRLRQKYGSLP